MGRQTWVKGGLGLDVMGLSRPGSGTGHRAMDSGMGGFGCLGQKGRFGSGLNDWVQMVCEVSWAFAGHRQGSWVCWFRKLTLGQ